MILGILFLDGKIMAYNKAISFCYSQHFGREANGFLLYLTSIPKPKGGKQGAMDAKTYNPSLGWSTLLST
jgi:hypothetical protein